MQVSQQSDRITHAVVGQQESISMGMSDSAALMHILSATLYTYPKLAAVREVICNGWDGHIMAGKTDLPLQITVTETMISVRDFGPGIPHEKIGPIYGTYGESTKRNDQTVTGGFGLGSKAPFAITDNFQVDSHNGGVKTIYRVSKSSMAVGGKPSINKIVAVPTEETGILVSFAIKEGQREEYEKLINEVLILGGILGSVNGHPPVEALPLFESPTGFIINSVRGTVLNRINVRYGNVVYPVPENSGFSDEWKTVMSQMNKLWHGSNIIFMAPPDSVSIAPSREALIFTDGTVATIKALLAQFTPDEVKNCEQAVAQTTSHMVNKVLETDQADCQPVDFARQVVIDAKQFGGAKHVSGPYAYTMRRARLNHLLSGVSMSQEGDDIFWKRFERAIRNNGFYDMKFARAMRKAILRQKHHYRENRNYSRMTAMFHRFISQPVYAAIEASEKMLMDRMYMSNGYHAELIRMKSRQVSDAGRAINHLFQKVLLVRSKSSAISFFSDLRRQHYNSIDRSCAVDGWIVYVCPSVEARIEETRKVFNDLGYEVHEHGLELPERIKPSDDPNWVPATKKASPKRKGYLTLAQSYDPDEKNFLLTTARANGDTAGLKDPVAWVILNSKSDHCEGRYFPGFEIAECRTANKLWGDKTAVVTAVQAQALIKKGVPDMKTFVAQYVDDTLSQRPDFPRYLAFGKYLDENQGTLRERERSKLVRNMLMHTDLMEELGIRFAITPETEMLIEFFSESRRPAMPKCSALAQKVKQNKKGNEMMAKLESSPWKGFLDLDHLSTALEKAAIGTPKYDIARTLVRHLLK